MKEMSDIGHAMDYKRGDKLHYDPRSIESSWLNVRETSGGPVLRLAPRATVRLPIFRFCLLVFIPSFCIQNCDLRERKVCGHHVATSCTPESDRRWAGHLSLHQTRVYAIFQWSNSPYQLPCNVKFVAEPELAQGGKF